MSHLFCKRNLSNTLNILDIECKCALRTVRVNNLWVIFAILWRAKNVIKRASAEHVTSRTSCELQSLMQSVDSISIVSNANMIVNKSSVTKGASFVAECEVRIWAIEFSVNRTGALFIALAASVVCARLIFRSIGDVSRWERFVWKGCYLWKFLLR